MFNYAFFWGAVLALTNILLASAVTVHAVLRKRDSRSVIGWVALAWLAPAIGSFVYFCFGVNRLHRKAAKLSIGELRNETQDQVYNDEDLRQIEAARFLHPNFVGLATVGDKLTNLPLLPGNKVTPLVDGDNAYPAMLEEIQNTTQSISLLSYIFDHDRVGKQFLDALVEAQKRGVEVRVLIDDVGSKYARPNMVRRLRRADIKAASFLPTRIPRLPTTANLRNHRKIMVVDGTVGFTGGTNIREGHCLGLDPKFPVRCLHFKIEGPVVSHLQSVFAIDWSFVTKEVLSGDRWFPDKPIERTGYTWARGVEHGPDESFERLKHLIASALACARQKVQIFTPYFLPQPSLIEGLNVAALRGVDVEIYIPRKNNIALVQWACMAELWQVLERGCRVFLTDAPFDHTKLMLIDDAWTLIGSTNWDPRSLRLNFEFNVECYGEELPRKLQPILADKIARSEEIFLKDVRSRPLFIKLRDGIARLASPYL